MTTTQQPSPVAAPHGRSGAARLPVELPPFPRVAGDLLVEPAPEPGAPWVVQRGDRFARLGADAARLLQSLDGSRSHEQVAVDLGRGTTVDQLRTVLARFQQLGFLDDGSAPGRRRRLEFRPPLSIQFTVADPSLLLGPLARTAARVSGRVAVGTVLLLGSLGVVLLAVQAADVVRVLAEPLNWRVFLAAYAGLLVVIALHEMAHATVLMRYGGRPRRMGVMLFYCNPAFFCDVSDGWRLPHSRQRVHVALAGIGLQVAAGGILAIAAAPLDGAPEQTLLLIALLSYVYGVFNLLPLVKFDGYIALMAHLDLPHLRDKAMADARAFLVRPLGGRHVQQLPGQPWAVAYGIACMVFPLYLLGAALSLWLGPVLNLGAAGALLVMIALALATAYLVRRFLFLLDVARAAGAPLWRRLAGGAVLLSVVGAALALIHVPQRLTAGYYTADGEVRLVIAEHSDGPDVVADARVTLRTQGLLLHHVTGGGTVGPSREDLPVAPFSALAAVSGVDATLPVRTYELRLDEEPSRDHGQAVVELPEARLGTWLWNRFVAPGLRTFG